MSKPEHSVVRILDVTGRPVGAGLLVLPTVVITYAHVVQRATGSLESGIQVQVDMPSIQSSETFSCQLFFMDPARNIACLEFLVPLTNETTSSLLTTDDAFWGARLAKAQSWLEKGNIEISDPEDESINLSILLGEREQKEKEEQQRRLREMEDELKRLRSELRTSNEEMERLLSEARDHAMELGIAREFAQRTAAENAKLYSSEQDRRQAAEALTKSARQLSSLGTVADVPGQVVAQLSQVVHNDHSALFLEDPNNVPRLLAHQGLPDNAPVTELRYELGGTNIYHILAKQSEPIVIPDVKNLQRWSQPEWLPEDRSWLGVPLHAKTKVIGMITLSRSAPAAFNQDDILLATTFAVQAGIALENARLYDDLNRFNQMMERMVEQRVDELNSAYVTLQKLDKNKSDFIQVAAHELRTPLTVIKGYLGLLKSAPVTQEDEKLAQITTGILQGTNRLHAIVNSMLDVARLENQLLTPQLEKMALGPVLRLIQKQYAADLAVRQLTLRLDSDINACPPLLADPGLLQKALDNVIVNAIKFTPDGGSIFVSARPIETDGPDRYCEIRIRDTGIGIDPTNHQIVFEKLYQLGKVELHTSGRTKFKGGGPGLGLAIAAGIVKAHKGKIWVESPRHDEETMPGSTFILHIPLAE